MVTQAESTSAAAARPLTQKERNPLTRLLIIGCGYVGRRLAQYYRALGREDLLGVTRTASSAAELEGEGVPARACDLACDALAGLPLAGAQVFHLAPPPARGVEDLHTRRLVAAFAHAPPSRLVYISTTGVYGDCDGAWVDETWPARPMADRARRRWDAEQTLRAWGRDSGAALVILRVAGIYGPDRLPLERIRQGLPLVRETEAPYSNRIHVDDLVAACAAAMERGADGAVYNVCDGAPTTMTDYFFRVADAVGLPRPPVISLAEAGEALSPGMLSYMSESRRLSNRRMIEELGVRLSYPTLDAGLRAAV